jgi:hypothetical protein
MRGDPTLADLEREFPAWECSQSFGWVWAQLRDNRDVRVRGEDTVDLRDMINRWIRRHPDAEASVSFEERG